MSAPPDLGPDDARLLRLAIALGRRHNGLTWPNPSVGAVLARPGPDGPRIIAVGITAEGGRPHAEQVAIAAAGAEARGATLYVSLEPCGHFGRTPPCQEAIVRAGIARVVYAVDDPDPRVAGRSAAFLGGAGIAVVPDAMPEEGRRAHRGHLTRVRAGRPWLRLKLAQTRDGYAAEPPGAPRLAITGPLFGARTHLWRAEADAVAVGVGTALADDPGLDVRLPGLERRSPLRVVFDTGLRLPPEGRLAASAGRLPLWLVCGEEAEAAREARLRDLGAEVIRVAAPGGRIALPDAMTALAARGLTAIFCEGGPALADALAAADLVDELLLATSDTPLGRPGLPAVGPHLAAALGTTLALGGEARFDTDALAVYCRA